MAQVSYESDGMVDKNKDTLYKDLLETVKLAGNKFLSETLFPETINKDDKKMPTTASFKIKVLINFVPSTILMKIEPSKCVSIHFDEEHTALHQMH